MQKEIYDQTRVKRPCSAYVMFMKDFMRSNVQDFANVRDAMRTGKLDDARETKKL